MDGGGGRDGKRLGWGGGWEKVGGARLGRKKGHKLVLWAGEGGGG